MRHDDREKHDEEEKDEARAEKGRIEPNVVRRLLQFLNAARQPDDLVRQPEPGVHVMAERYTFRGPDFHEAMARREQEAHKPEILMEAKLAKQVLEWRDEQAPAHGFTHLKQFIELIPARILERLLEWFRFWFGRASRGEWAAPIAIPAGFDRPVHAALVRSPDGKGRVLCFGLPSGNNTFLWDPSVAGPAGFNAPTNQPTDSLFCSGHAHLSDGRVLVVGGGGDGTVTPRHNRAWKFDPSAESWTRVAGNGTPDNGNMSFVRWYPTCVTMGDEPGRVLIVSGVGGPLVTQMEVYFETSDRFELVWGPGGSGDTSGNRSFPQLYPGLNLLPGGEVFYTPTGWASGGTAAVDYPSARPSAYFTFGSTSVPVTGSWHEVGPIAVPPSAAGPAELALDRVKGMAALLLQPSYPYVQVIVVGGGQSGTSTDTYQMVNLSELIPEWGDPLELPDALDRVNVNLVLLPDGKVFMCGGRPQGGTPSHGGQCWMYDPSTSVWAPMDELNHERRYHSVALLLPSGQVMAAGNESTNDRTIEVFSPPYLFDANGTPAARPVISGSPNLVHHGSSFAIDTPAAPEIGRVVLVRPMAVTHQTDSEQRVIPLTFVHTSATRLTATAPDGWHPHAIAPRGWYLLFILNTRGVPSEGKFIYLH